MTIEEKKSKIIAKVSQLDDDRIIDAVHAILNENVPLKPGEAGWGKNMVTYISDDFDDFIPPGFSK